MESGACCLGDILATVSVTVAVEIPIILAFRDRAAVMRIVAMAVIFTICVLVVSVTNNQDILVALTSIPDGLLMLIGGVVRLVCTAASGRYPIAYQQSRMVIVGDCGCDADTIMHTGA